MRIAICILIVKENQIVIDFLESMDKYHKENRLKYDIYLITDREDSIELKSDLVNIIQIDHKEATNKGFKNSLLRYYHLKDIKKTSLALDKCLYYMTRINKIDYDHYWLIEDDCFIPSVKTISSIDKKYPEADLLTESFQSNVKEGDKIEGHFPLMIRNNRNRNYKKRLEKAKTSTDYYLPLPWYKCFCASIRISNKFLKKIDEFVKKNKTLIFMELMFPTMAQHHKLHNICIPEIITRYVDGKRNQNLWKFSEIRKGKLYNMIKDFDIQKEWRKRLT